MAFFVLTALVFALDCCVLRKHFMLDHVFDTPGNLISLFSLNSACEDLLKVHGHGYIICLRIYHTTRFRCSTSSQLPKFNSIIVLAYSIFEEMTGDAACLVVYALMYVVTSMLGRILMKKWLLGSFVRWCNVSTLLLGSVWMGSIMLGWQT
jgi:hypothetical protein